MGSAVYARVIPPAIEIAKAFFKAKGRESQQSGSAHSTLTKCWEDRHCRVRHNQLRQIGKTEAPQMSPCYFIGTCICQSHRGRMLAQLTRSFQTAIRRLFCKGSVPRRLYEKGSAVLRICRPCDNLADSLWIHYGYSNLVTGVSTMTLLEYVSVDDDVVNLEALAQESRPASKNIWTCLAQKGANFNYEFSLDLQLFCLDTRPTPVDTFLPKRVTVIKVDPLVESPFWRPGALYITKLV